MEASAAAQAAQVDMTSDVSSVPCVSSRDHGTATVFCKECHNFYCDICYGSHNVSMSLKCHTVMSFSEMSPNDFKSAKSAVKKTTCTKHWQPVTYWCKTCRERVCTTCCVFKHMSHTLKLQPTETKAHTGEADSILCNKNDHGRASVLCRECTCFYCETCSVLHQNFDSMGGHKMTPVKEMSNTAIARARVSVEDIICLEHRQRSGHLCKTCKQLMCRTCCQLKHKNHIRDDLELVGADDDSPKLPGRTPKKLDIAGSSGKQNTIPCFQIVHGEATTFCTDCTKCYCKDCSADHQLYNSMSGHKMKPIDQVSSKERDQALLVDARYQCREHKTPFNTICKTCNTLMCQGCYGTKCWHNNHQTLNEAAKNAKLQLQYIIAETTRYIKEQNKLLAELRHNRCRIPFGVKTAKIDIKAAAEAMRQTINNHEDYLLHNVDYYKNESLESIDSVMNEHQASKAAAVNCNQQIECLCKFGEDIDLIQQAPVMQETVHVRKQAKQRKVTWKYILERNQLTEEQLKVLFGQVHLATATLLGNPRQQVRLNYTDDQTVSGMVVVGGSLCITHKGDSNLWLYDLTTGHANKCLVPNLKDPCGMAVLKSADRTVVIADTNYHNQLHFVNISTDLTIKYVKGKHIPVERPFKISCSARGNYVELLIGQLDDSAFIVCNADGDLPKRIAVATPDQVERVPLCVERTQAGHVALMWDRNTSCIIQWIYHNGKCTKTYGSQNSKLLNQAPSIAVDNAGKVILVDFSNSKLHLVNMAGRQFLLTRDHGIVDPMCVFLDEISKQLYVAHGQVGSMEVRAYGWPDPHTTNFQLKLRLGTF